MNQYNSTVHHRRSIRLKGYDYAQQGMYFINICCQDRVCRLGHVTNGEMILNEFRRMARDEWSRTPEIRPNVTLGEFVVMPNHMHGIIGINRTGELHSPHNPNALHSPHNPDVLHSVEIQTKWQSFGIDHDPHTVGERGVHNTPLRSPSQTVGAIVRGY